MAETPLVKRQRAYRQLFLTPNGTIPEGVQRVVLADLAKFCHASKPATKVAQDGHVDSHATMQVIGRQEVWQRLQAMLELPMRDVTIMGETGD